MSRRPSVLVADDHPVVAEALASSLERWFRVAGIVHALDEIDAAIRCHAPRATLIDLSFGDDSALPLLPRLTRDYPETRFIVLTAHAEPVLAEAALRAGAMAYVVKQSAPAEVRVAIEEAFAGRTYVTPLVRPRSPDGGIVDAALRQGNGARLSTRQKQILRRLRAGETYRQIADAVGLTTKTLEYHIEGIRSRSGLSRTTQLVRWAEGNGLDVDDGVV